MTARERSSSSIETQNILLSTFVSSSSSPSYTASYLNRFNTADTFWTSCLSDWIQNRTKMQMWKHTYIERTYRQGQGEQTVRSQGTESWYIIIYKLYKYRGIWRKARKWWNRQSGRSQWEHSPSYLKWNRGCYYSNKCLTIEHSVIIKTATPREKKLRKTQKTLQCPSALLIISIPTDACSLEIYYPHVRPHAPRRFFSLEHNICAASREGAAHQLPAFSAGADGAHIIFHPNSWDLNLKVWIKINCVHRGNKITVSTEAAPWLRHTTRQGDTSSLCKRPSDLWNVFHLRRIVGTKLFPTNLWVFITDQTRASKKCLTDALKMGPSS